MRPAILFLIFLHFANCGSAQISKMDSLSGLLANTKADTNRVTLLWRLAEQYQSINPDTSLKLSRRALLLARRLKYTEGESRSLAILATSQYLLGNYPTALNNYMLKLKIEEKRNSPRNYVSALSNIGLMYILLGEYCNALSYLNRANAMVDATGGKTKEELKYNILVNIGETYYRMKKLDSSGIYFKKALTIARHTGDGFSLGTAMLGAANVLALKEDNQAALKYYYPAFNYLNDGWNNETLCEVTLGMAKVYEKLGQVDSAYFFGNKSFGLAEQGRFLLRQLNAAQFLSRHFKEQGMYERAFAYMDRATTLNDSIKGQQKTREAMIISNNEQMRQAELAELRLQEKELRSRQLQVLVIAIFIPGLFLLTLFISRKKVHDMVVRYLGIISLLFLFEFVTLLLHPMVAKFAHHILLFELVIFVIIAAGIIPLHHRLEHLMLEKLTKRRKIVTVASAEPESEEA